MLHFAAALLCALTLNRQWHDQADARAWAKEHGREISDRGRILASVMKEYEAAQGS